VEVSCQLHVPAAFPSVKKEMPVSIGKDMAMPQTRLQHGVEEKNPYLCYTSKLIAYSTD
jgi:hypothetical protein